jgi:hypothetical protein
VKWWRGRRRLVAEAERAEKITINLGIGSLGSIC